MKKWNFTPLKSIGDIDFGIQRNIVRDKLNLSFEEYEKNEYSENTTDDYKYFHVHYDKNNLVEAVEFFKGDIEIYYNDKKIFPANIKDLIELFPKMKRNDEEYYIEYDNSIGLEIGDNGDICSILFGVSNYYIIN